MKQDVLKFVFSLVVGVPGIVIGILIIPLVFPLWLAWKACEDIMKWIEKEGE